MVWSTDVSTSRCGVLTLCASRQFTRHYSVYCYRMHWVSLCLLGFISMFLKHAMSSLPSQSSINLTRSLCRSVVKCHNQPRPKPVGDTGITSFSRGTRDVAAGQHPHRMADSASRTNAGQQSDVSGLVTPMTGEKLRQDEQARRSAMFSLTIGSSHQCYLHYYHDGRKQKKLQPLTLPQPLLSSR